MSLNTKQCFLSLACLSLAHLKVLQSANPLKHVHARAEAAELYEQSAPHLQRMAHAVLTLPLLFPGQWTNIPGRR